MTFNHDITLDSSNIQRRGRGRRSAAIGGGGALGIIVIALVSQWLGVDLSQFMGGADQGSDTAQELPTKECLTGADANEDDECRMIGAANSLEAFWDSQVNGYVSPQVILFSDTTSSACGTASAATGPFYCPVDQSIYVDTAFFSTLRQNFGASAGPLAQMYVLAHEWGHHISNITGDMDNDRGSGATGGSVRLELQADCYAGAWVNDASTVVDADTGVPFLRPVTEAQIADALDAAAAVGDDNIMEKSGHAVNPDAFTHGSSEQRQHWFMEGYNGGPAACNTFAVPDKDL